MRREVKNAAREKYCAGETRAILTSREGGSGAGPISSGFGLKRAIIKLVLRELQDRRNLQVTFCNIICGAELKCFEKGILLLTV